MPDRLTRAEIALADERRRLYRRGTPALGFESIPLRISPASVQQS